ncbi:MAG TPA: HAMP domain-containing sensor histidine kinase [Jatrophihabitans sp.]|nr:HAMP domain-containing sensor histidine kinase [Jatrophihabitans sp.]
MKRTSLATRISLLSVGIAVLTAAIAGGLAIGLIRNGGTDTARQNLGRLADVAASAGENGRVTMAIEGRLRNALRALDVQGGLIGPSGRVVSASTLVRASLSRTEAAAVVAGDGLSLTRTVDGTQVFVEARAAGRGGIVLVQRRSDAVAQDERAIRRTILALLIAGGLAAVLGLVVAWQLARPLRRTAGAAHSLAAGNRDVRLPAEGPAEVVEVSEAVNCLAGALRQSEARQREFLLSVSHDLRTPLTAIAGYAESLAGGVVPPEQTSQVGGVLLGEAKRLERLVGDLLDLARLGAQDFRVEFAPVDITALVHGVARVWAARCTSAGVEFRLEAPESALWTTTDATRLRQVLDGLFDNALRITPHGAPIVLAARGAPGQALLEVRDGGPGLSDADLGVAFEQGVLYERYRGVRQVGTGLGLAIVHGLVQRLGGTIEAGHAQEGGARFTVRLPA